MSRSRDDALFWVGVTLWVAVIAATWPNALSFGDEVGYLAQTKLFLSGHLRHVPFAPGVWIPSPHGLINKYPLLHSLVLTPFVALAPRLAFAVTLIAAIVLVSTARAILTSWGRNPLWALLVLAHPTVVILSRTVMADIPQATVVLGGWWALRRGRTAATVAWFALLIALKPTGAVLAVGVVAGEALSSLRALRARDVAAWRRLAWAAVGCALGFAILLVSNYASNGTLWFSYDHTGLGTPPFWYTYLPARVPVHLATLLLNPPLLIIGAWPFWRRRELGPLILSGGYLALMCVYFFVDTGATRLESMVLSPRLILPAVVFLLVGYGAWLDELARRLGTRALDDTGQMRPWLAAILVAVPLAVAGGVSARHARFQEPMGRALTVASGLADARGSRVLGITEDAAKVGVLYHGGATLFDATSNRPAVVLCSETPASHRAADYQRSCALAGYREIGREGGYVVLTRLD